MRTINYSLLPEHMQDGMRRYIENGVQPGRFLYLILCNDFVRAIGHADMINMARIIDYARFLYSELATECWGSKEQVENWMERKKREEAEKRKKDD